MEEEMRLEDVILAARHLRRQGWAISAREPGDTLAEHLYMTAIIADVIARELQPRHRVDPGRAVELALWHDIVETIAGDVPWPLKHVMEEHGVSKNRLEEYLAEKYLPQYAASALAEYNRRETLESRIAKAADIISLLLVFKEYIEKGNEHARRSVCRTCRMLRGYIEKNKFLLDSAFVLYSLHTCKRVCV